ncbi:MurR/RpiR family transcriptional regulator [Mycolicibacterium arenosum]|uniref:MurR/RpiR family transcriptional regulator n=1 Tax=Mycolicibacterium arenosum TaxID=2952157 RepID=A0ABT1MCG2_9MYCO|nr:MurR/RpiR family transcriptional regulator [Mycolicibacterium sp. CAU 1645]MCP9276562.1 MurR/RpiR family transcriptional regulator [Mycolicibacterium sp. CAU 1645]
MTGIQTRTGGGTLSGPPGSVAALIQARMVHLSAGERRIAEVMLARGQELIYNSVSDVAVESGSALSSVVRCCQSLGFKGFQDLKIALSRDGGSPVRAVQGEVGPGDVPPDILKKVIAAASEAVATGTGYVDPDRFTAAVELIGTAGKTLFLGVGTSAPLAQDIANRLMTIGVHTEAPADVHVQHVRASLLVASELAVAISHTGSTRETVSAARAAKQAGAAVLAVTSFAHSPLVDVADVVLIAGSRETAYRVEAMSSRLAHLVVLDALFVAVAFANEDRANRALEVTEGVLADHRF